MYNKTIWENKVTPVDADNLNKIEDAIEKISIETDENIKDIAALEQEVVASRNGEDSLDIRLDKIDVEISEQQAVDEDFEKRIETNTNEIINARKGKKSLKEKIDSIDAELNRQEEVHTQNNELIASGLDEALHQINASKKHLVNIDETLEFHKEELDRIENRNVEENEITSTAVNELYRQANALKKETMSLVELSADNSAEIVRNTIPSGFTTISPIDFSKENNGSITLKDESVAYVNGYEIRIPKGTVITVGEAPEGQPREDLLFLEAWKDNEFTRTGKLSWRIRHVADVDFNKFTQDGFTIIDGFEVDGNRFNNIPAQANNLIEQPFSMENRYYSSTQRTYWTKPSQSPSVNNISIDDVGLYVAGRYNGRSIEHLNTLDGYCYAIPMFRLYRKPSCGLAKPFEYQKIHSKVDSKAFSERVKGDKVEKYEEIVIKGKTYQNPVPSSYFINWEDLSKLNWSSRFLVADTYIDTGEEIRGAMVYKSNREYTLVVKITKNTSNKPILLNNFSSSSCVFDAYIEVPLNFTGVYVTKINTVDISKLDRNAIILRAQTRDMGGSTGTFNASNFMILEGDHTNNPDILEYFEGIKSVGEKENNVVTVKSTGKNLFNINNLLPGYSSGGQEHLDYSVLVQENTISVEHKGKSGFFKRFEMDVKEGKKYTVAFTGDTNSLQDGIGPTINIYSDKLWGNSICNLVSVNNYRRSKEFRPVGTNKIIVGIYMPSSSIKGETFTFKDIQIVEGVDAPYEPYKESRISYQLTAPLRQLPNGVCDEINGKKVIRRVGRYTVTENDKISLSGGNNQIDVTAYRVEGISFNCKNYSSMVCNRFIPKYDVPSWQSNTEGVCMAITQTDIVTCYIRLLNSKLGSSTPEEFKKWLKTNPVEILYELEYPVEEILTECISTKTDFTLNRQFEKTEKNYLLELPNGVKDEIIDGQVTRRVGEAVFNGTENWLGQGNHNDTTMIFSLAPGALNVALNKQNSNNHLNSKFKDYIIFYDSIDFEGAFISNTGAYYVRILKSRLSTLVTAGFKSWLSTNPTSVLYELETPTIEPLTDLNNEYYPVTEKSNQYTGALYYQDGINYTKSINSISSSGIEVNTGKRVIVEEIDDITDCAYKKHYDGMATVETLSKNSNLAILQELRQIRLTEESGNLWDNNAFPDKIVIDKDGTVTWTDSRVTDWSDIGVIVKCKPNTTYTFSVNILDVQNSRNNIVVGLYKKYPKINVDKGNKDSYIGIKKPSSNTDIGLKKYTFTTDSEAGWMYCSISVENIGATCKFKDFQVSEGIDIPFELGSGEPMGVEDIEENDISDLRHLVSLSGFNYQQLLDSSFDALLLGNL